MHVATTRRHYKGKEYESTLLRRSYRKDGKVRNETLGNLSHLPPEVIDAIRAMLAGKALVDLDRSFEIERSLPHGHVAAVLGVLRALDLERLIGRERCRERDLVVAMIVQRADRPGLKALRDTALWCEHARAMSWVSARSRRPSCWARWTGCLSVRSGSSGRSLAGTSPAGEGLRAL